MKYLISFVIGVVTTLLTTHTPYFTDWISKNFKINESGFEDGIPQKMNTVNVQERYRFTYTPDKNEIFTNLDGESFKISGGTGIYGIFNDIGVVSSGELTDDITNFNNLDFVFFSKNYVYVFKWEDIQGTRYRRSEK